MAFGHTVINPAVLEPLLNSPNGPVAGVLMFVAEDIVQETKVQLSVPYIRGTRTPKGGPPRARSRDLLNSVHAEAPREIDGVLTVQCIADAVHRGWYYGQILRDEGYVFIDLENTRIFTPFT